MPSHPSRWSKSFVEYLDNRQETVELLKSTPPIERQLGERRSRQLANALYRACVVLMSSHLERYVEALVVESIDAINAGQLHANALPEQLRLRQIKAILRQAYETDKLSLIEDELRRLNADFVWFWNHHNLCAGLTASVLISDFDNPLPKRIRTLFAPFGNGDIVGPAVALDQSQDRPLIEGKVRELVEKRNAIAHTGMTTDLTREDVLVYLRCLRRFVRGIDIIVGRQIEQIIGKWPW
jgi:hypothetical protein